MEYLTTETKNLLFFLQLPTVGIAKLRSIAKTMTEHNSDIQILINRALIPKDSEEYLNAAEAKANRIIELCNKYNIEILSCLDNYYPHLLKKIADYPPLIYAKGSLTALSNKCAAVVGTRKASDVGKKISKKISESLANNGFTIVSGLALGIDTSAHEGTLKANGTTIAILAHGLDTVTPKSNSILANKILENGGTLVSEHPPEVPAYPPEYAKRNRIQSGMSNFSVIIETGEKGGTIHQAKFTKSQGKELYVVIPPNEDVYSCFNASGGQMIINNMGGIKIGSTIELLNRLSIPSKRVLPLSTQMDLKGF
ncbi:DNA-processing protein DprA [Desulforegula conservatrix]|uniref:DNA-processing protein DprA n=1 Tax=Desulforegula conservatrix TaxID=153026 RepID=UPI0003F8F0B9|nr:DNA-processing protein DprA [Desulforegula conservatrix]